MKLQGNDHLVLGPRVEDDLFKATVHREEGAVIPVEVVMKERGKGDSESQMLSTCDGAPEGAPIFHAADTRGPAMVNSAAYCAGYERIFGKRGPHGGN